MLDQNISTPLYEQLKVALKEDIRNKIYKPGDRMPSEIELEKQYSVSRITVRRAIKELCEENILIRKQGKGTFVLDKDNYRRIDSTVGGFHEALEAEGKKVTVDIIEKKIIKVNASYARDLQIKLTDDVVYLKRIMYADEKPIMIDTCYIPLNRFPGVYDKLVGNVAVFSMLENEYGVHLERYYKVLKVRLATEEMSLLKKKKKGDPMFDLFKITYDSKGMPQSISISILKGEDTYYVITNSEGDEVNQNGLSWRI